MTSRNNDRLFYIETLKSEQCQCERSKKRRYALCYKCFQRLPKDLRMALYRPIGAGFEQAYEDAYRYLNNL